jgi:hypothetical protein
MSPSDFKTQQMHRNEVKRHLFALDITESTLIVTNHVRKRMDQRNVTLADAINVLKSPAAKFIREPRFELGSWSYSCETNKFRVAFAFQPDGNSIVLVTVVRL